MLNSAKTAATNGAKLSKVAGEWNHITVIFAYDNSMNYTIEGQDEPIVAPFDKNLIANIDVAKELGAAYEHEDGKNYIGYSYNLKNSKAYFYINGEFFAEKAILTSIKPDTVIANDSFYDLRHRFVEDLSFHSRFSVGYDNLAFHAYEDGYAGPLANLINNFNRETPLYTLSDVLFAGTYNVPNAEPAAIVCSAFDKDLPADQKTEKNLVPVQEYDILYGIGDNVSEQGYLKLYKSVDNVYPKKSFYVKCVNGAEFSLAIDSGYKISAEPAMGDDWYFVTEAMATDFINIAWYDSVDSAIPHDEIEKVQVGADITFKGEFSAPPVYVEDNLYRTYIGWAYVSFDGAEPEYHEVTSETLTEALFQFGKNEGFGELSLYPLFGNVPAAIEVVAADGARTPYFDASEFTKAYKTLTDGATIILSEDVTVDTDKTVVTVPANTTYNFDLNGSTFSQTGADTDGIVFQLNTGATLNLYSSKVGGTVKQTGNSKVFNAAVKGTTINIGKPGDKSGDEAKVNIFGSRMIDVNGTHTYLADNGDPENPITFNIYGLNFASYKTLASYAVFAARTYTEINAVDSNFAVIGFKGSSNEARLLTTDGRFHTRLTAVFENCSIYTFNNAGTGVGYVCKELTRGSTVTLKDCVVHATTSISTGLVHGATIGLEYYPPVADETAEEKAAREELNKANKNTSSTFFSPESKAPGYKNMESSYSASGKIFIEGNTVFAGVTALTSRAFLADGTVNIKIGAGAEETKLEFVYYNAEGKVTVEQAVGYIASYPENVDDEKYAVVTIEGETQYWVPGSAIPAGVSQNNINGLYNREFTGWLKDGEAIETIVAGTYTLTGFSYVANITGVKLNLTANNGFVVNFYTPAKADLKADVEGVAYNAQYNVFSVNAPVAGDGSVSITFTFEISGYGEMSQTFTVSLLDYFNAILASDNETEASKTLVVNAVNYCNELYKYANEGADFEGYKTILEENASRIITAENAQPVEVNPAEQTAFSTVQFIIGEGNVPMFAFTKTADAVVSIKFKSIYGFSQEIVCSVVNVNGVDYYAVEEMPVYEMIDAFEVYVDGTKVGDYTLANYVVVSENALASALYGYGVAVKNWKIED